MVGKSVKVQSDLIHERHDRRMKPSQWILTFVYLFILLLFSLSLIVLPAYRAVSYKGWAYTLLLLTALGLCLTRISIRLLSKYIWESRHSNSYMLYQNRIEFIQCDRKKREKLQEIIPFEQIEKVFIGRYFTLYHYAYKKSSWKEKQPLAHILPCLHIVYADRFVRKVVEIPFDKMDGIDIWLTKLQGLGIPVQAYVGYMSNMNMERRLEMLADPIYVIPFIYKVPLQREYNQLVRQMDRQIREHICKKKTLSSYDAKSFLER